MFYVLGTSIKTILLKASVLSLLRASQQFTSNQKISLEYDFASNLTTAIDSYTEKYVWTSYPSVARTKPPEQLLSSHSTFLIFSWHSALLSEKCIPPTKHPGTGLDTVASILVISDTHKLSTHTKLSLPDAIQIWTQIILPSHRQCTALYN